MHGDVGQARQAQRAVRVPCTREMQAQAGQLSCMHQHKRTRLQLCLVIGQRGSMQGRGQEGHLHTPSRLQSVDTRLPAATSYLTKDDARTWLAHLQCAGCEQLWHELALQ